MLALCIRHRIGVGRYEAFIGVITRRVGIGIVSETFCIFWIAGCSRRARSIIRILIVSSAFLGTGTGRIIRVILMKTFLYKPMTVFKIFRQFIKQ
jgi:hypothetical protein